jgi:phospholipid/cholesterol/gamma-HCH transport system substrate-binding protein
MEVNDENKSRITDHSRASIGSLSLLGEPIIEISPSSEGTPLKDGDFIQSERTSGQFTDVAENATQTLEQTTALIKEIRAGKGTVGKLFTDEQMYREMNQLVASAETVTAAINRGNGTLGLLIRDPAVYRQATDALTNLQEMTRRINAGEGSIGKLLRDEQLAKSLNSTSANLDQVTGRLSRFFFFFCFFLFFLFFFFFLFFVVARIDKLTADLEQGEGAAGQLLHNKQLYENMNGAATELRGLIAEIRKDPKKYLNVRVSIF